MKKVLTGTPEAIHALDAGLDSWPLPQDAIREGRPLASGHVIARSQDRRGITGIWECTPGRFAWSYAWDETLYVLKGRGAVEEVGGSSIEFTAGDVVHLPLGLVCIWTIRDELRKVFTILSPEPVDL